MTERFITPPEPLVVPRENPLVFLAGPVQGAPNWQERFAHILLDRSPEIFVASPRRTPENQLRFDATEQVDWEHTALERARKLGAIAFWWAAQDLSDQTYPAGRAYAQTTRVEFGKACGWKQFQPNIPVIVGYDLTYGENGGGSESYIRKEAKLADISVYDSESDFLCALTDSIDRLLRN